MKRIFLMMSLLWMSTTMVAQSVESKNAVNLPQPDFYAGKLVAPWKADAELTEFRGQPVIRYGNMDLSWYRLAWKGVDDFSISLRTGWTDQGVCLGFRVLDDDVKGADSLTISFRPAGYSRIPNNLTLKITPPLDGQAMKCAVTARPKHNPAGTPEFAGIPIKGGYQFELLVPYSLLPDFESREKSFVRIHLGIIEDDKAHTYPYCYGRGLESDQGHDRAFSMGLREKAISTPVKASEFQVYSNFRLAKPILERNPEMEFEIAEELLGEGDSVELELGGRKLTLPFQSFVREEDGFYVARSNALDLRGLRDGVHPLRRTLKRNGTTIIVERTIQTCCESRELLDQTVAALSKIGIGELSEKDPFRASAYMSVVGAVEWLKWGLIQQADHAIVEGAREIRNRMALLAGKPLPDSNGAYALLELSRDPEQQLVVEYFRERTKLNPFLGSVAVYWGSFPLVSGMFREYGTPEQAQKELAALLRGVPSKQVLLDGVPGYDAPQFLFEKIDEKSFRPEEDAWVFTDPKTAVLVPITDLPIFGVDRVFLAPGTPEKTRIALTETAKKLSLKVWDGNDKTPVFRTTGFLGTFDPASTYGKMFASSTKRKLELSPGTGALYFAKGRIVYHIPYVSRAAAERFAKVLLAGKAISASDRAFLRSEILKTTGRTPKKLALPPGMDVFCGDMHTHSFLSDGRPTPLTVTAAAVYCGLDFHLLSDHGVFHTAYEYLKNTVRKFNLDYPVGVGVELNSQWGHMNVYPMPEDSECVMGPTFEEMVRHSHSLNAVIQWNHPDTDYSNLPNYLANGLEGSGLDAWEHYPPHYTAWKKAGKLPVLTGGTDTHNGTYHMPERSVLFLPDAETKSLADGVRRGACLMLDPWNGAYTITRGMENKSRWDSDLYFYGSDPMIQLAVDALADPEYMIRLKKKRIREYLKSLDVRGLIESSDAFESIK